jgi:hypothetical protein
VDGHRRNAGSNKYLGEHAQLQGVEARAAGDGLLTIIAALSDDTDNLGQPSLPGAAGE